MERKLAPLYAISPIREELSKCMMSKFVSVGRVARILGINTATVRRLCAGGCFGAVKSGGKWRVSADGLLEYLERNHSWNQG